jgi:hypothetical protein
MAQIQATRIQTSLQESETLRREVDHYFFKTRNLEKKFKRAKEPNKTLETTLVRNRNKYKKAKKLYDRHSNELCLLIEEMTERGWRDLFPVLLKLTQSDLYCATFEYELMCQLHGIIENMKDIGEKFQVTLNTRTELYQSASAAFLSTKHLEMQGLGVSMNEEDCTSFQDDMSSFLERSHATVPDAKAAEDDDKIRRMDKKFAECVTIGTKNSSFENDDPDITIPPDEKKFVDENIALAPAPVLDDYEDQERVEPETQEGCAHEDIYDDIVLSPAPTEVMCG